MKSEINGNRYVLAVKNLTASADSYKNKLGFNTLWEGSGWHFLIRDSSDEMFAKFIEEKR
jgi:hypothetical protein